MTEENTQAPVEETEQKPVEEKKEKTEDTKPKVVGQYNQSIFVGEWAGKIDITSWSLINSDKDYVYHFTVTAPVGDPIKLVIYKDDLYNISTLAMNAAEMLE